MAENKARPFQHKRCEKWETNSRSLCSNIWQHCCRAGVLVMKWRSDRRYWFEELEISPGTSTWHLVMGCLQN
eukprot:4695635-Amphidinium_carterae.1